MSLPERSSPPEGDHEESGGGQEPSPVGHPALRLFWKLVGIGVGGTLVLLGIVGLFLPVLQGWLMIFAGLALLSPHSRRARRILKTLKAKIGLKEKP